MSEYKKNDCLFCEIKVDKKIEILKGSGTISYYGTLKKILDIMFKDMPRLGYAGSVNIYLIEKDKKSLNDILSFVINLKERILFADVWTTREECSVEYSVVVSSQQKEDEKQEQ